MPTKSTQSAVPTYTRPFSERQCYRFALGQAPTLTHDEWTDMLAVGGSK